MVHNFFKSIRRFNGRSGFDTYLMNIQRDSGDGVVSINEARSDYKALLKVSSGYLLR